MKLSEAIRLGAMLKPQGFGDAFTLRGNAIASCALGAANDAVFGETLGPSRDDEPDMPIYFRYLLILEPYVNCPACGVLEPVKEVIAWHLNDSHRWTREQIADWVETIEAQQAAGAVDPAGELAKRELATRG